MSERFTASGKGKAYLIGWGYNLKDDIEQFDYRQDEWLDALAKKMQEYEDLEEQGRLVKLPCKVGDTVYVVKSDEVKTYTVNHFTIIKNGTFAYLVISYSEKGVANVRDFGNTVFLTHEEAEAALKGTDE